MSMIREGNACVLCAGRRSGQEVTITKVVDENFVMVKDKKGKERRALIKHLMSASKKK